MAKGREVKVFSAGSGYRVIRCASRAKAEKFEAMGIWRREYDPANGEQLGFRVVGIEDRKMDSELPRTPTVPEITAIEMEMNLMRSRTYRLSEEQRLKLIKDGKMPEDAIERAKAKIRVYPFVGAAKGDILKVWPR